MYAYLKGNIAEKHSTHIVIDVGGVGYSLQISLNTYETVKNIEEVLIYTWLQVREDDLTLFGFATKEERSVFLKLLSVNGISANLSRLILSNMAPQEIIACILEENVDKVRSVKGIGLKTAQRVILELKDKLGDIPVSHESRGQGMDAKEEAIAALMALGYHRAVAAKAVDKSWSSNHSLEEIIKKALKLV